VLKIGYGALKSAHLGPAEDNLFTATRPRLCSIGSSGSFCCWHTVTATAH